MKPLLTSEEMAKQEEYASEVLNDIMGKEGK